MINHKHSIMRLPLKIGHGIIFSQLIQENQQNSFSCLYARTISIILTRITLPLFIKLLMPLLANIKVNVFPQYAHFHYI